MVDITAGLTGQVSVVLAQHIGHALHHCFKSLVYVYAQRGDWEELEKNWDEEHTARILITPFIFLHKDSFYLKFSMGFVFSLENYVDEYPNLFKNMNCKTQ